MDIWVELDRPTSGPKDTTHLEVIVTLKKKFHRYQESFQHRFLCTVQMGHDPYRPKISIVKKTPGQGKEETV